MSALSNRGAAPLIYLGGTGALMLCDVMVSSWLQADDVASWALVRAVSGVFGILCLLGLDQYVLRYPERAPQIRRILVIQIPAIAVLAAFIGHQFSIPFYLTISVAIVSTVAIAVSQFQRSRGSLVHAQLSAQLWKVIFLFGMAYYVFAMDGLDFRRLVVICSAVSVIGVAGIGLAGPRGPSSEDDREGLFSIYSTSTRLMAISGLTGLSIYLEQLAVNAFGARYEAALYFTHATYFLFSASLVNGYLAFLAVPWAKRNKKAFLEILSRRWRGGIALSILYVVVVQAVALAVWWLLNPAVGQINLVLLMAFSVSAFARTIYTYPSAYWGAFGSPADYTLVIRCYILSFVSAIGVFLALWAALGLTLVHSVALASASNWMLRSIIGVLVVRSAYRREVVC